MATTAMQWVRMRVGVQYADIRLEGGREYELDERRALQLCTEGRAFAIAAPSSKWRTGVIEHGDPDVQHRDPQMRRRVPQSRS